MSRARTISIDGNALLRGIAAAIDSDLQAAEAELETVTRLLASGAHGEGVRRLAGLDVELARLNQGIRFDLRRFLGRVLTPSERNVARRQMRDLEAAGLIELHGQRATWVSLTRAGRALLAEGGGDD